MELFEHRKDGFPLCTILFGDLDAGTPVTVIKDIMCCFIYSSTLDSRQDTDFIPVLFIIQLQFTRSIFVVDNDA